MADHEATLALRARFVFPVHGPPISDGCVTIRNGQIAAVGTSAPACPTRDLGNAAILPGLVNAHTHIEFSDLAAPLGRPGTPLPDWIRQVIAHRRALATPDADYVKRGLRESLLAGTTLLGEIATSDWRSAAPADTMPDTVMFHESIAPTLDRVAGAMAAAEAFLAADSLPGNITAAISPHAPYTVHPQLLTELVALARQFQVPLAMHLSESREELEWMQSGGGPFGQLLRDFSAGDSSAESRLPHVLDYLQHLAQAPRALVIHGNYLTAAEIEFVAANAGTMSVVYCPRTHAFFRHEPYPLARMLNMGVAMALGTDSRASNPDLSLLAELRSVAQHHPGVPAAKVLELATLAGARALGLDVHAGTLEVGKAANLTVVGLSGEADDPHQLLLGASARVIQTWLHGIPFPIAGNW